MRIGRSVYCYKTEDLVLVHLNSLTRRQIIRHNDRWLHIIHIHRCMTGQILNETVGNITDICRSRLHIIIIHAGKHLGKIITGHCNRILCIHHFIADHIADGILIILIFQHHLMHLKNRCAGFTNFFHCLIIQFLQLFLRCTDRILHTGDLTFCICDFFPFYLDIILLEHYDRSQCNSLINRFSFVFLCHITLPLHIHLLQTADLRLLPHPLPAV